MNNVMCPNCRTITPPWRYCANCNAPLDYFFNQSFSKQPRQCMMDPHLHRLVQRVQDQGICKLKTASTDEGWLTVIARVKDLDAFRALDDVVIGAVIPPVPKEYVDSQKPKDETDRMEKGTIVTARMPVNIVEYVRRQPFVYSLKAGQRMRPWLENVRKETQADTETKSTDGTRTAVPVSDNKGGEGVIVGIVDFGMDFMHRNFRNEDGSSRILALWDQTASADPRYMQPQPFGYGRLYTQANINAAIEESDNVTVRRDPEQVCAAAYRALGYEPPADSVFQIGAHGTYVADVAVGNGRGTFAADKANGRDVRIPGLAPKAEIVFVEISTQPGAPMLGQSFGDSAQLLEAICFIFDYAGEQPCVINLSLGTNGGPHDGSTLVEIAIDRLLSDPQRPNRAVVVAAGNAYGQDLHATGKVPRGGTAEIKWFIPKHDSTPNELEIWYSKDDRFTVEVIDPKRNSLAIVAPGWHIDLSDNYRGFMTIVNRLNDPNNNDNNINIFFESGLPDGEWTLRLHGTSVKKGEFHAWIERDETGQARFIGKKKDQNHKEEYGAWIDDSCTLSSIACGEKTIVVGSFDARKKEKNNADPKYDGHFQLSKTTSAGRTRDGREKPDVVAPGELVLAARSRTLILRNRTSGTSLSAAAVTGIVALMMAKPSPERMSLTANEILKTLRTTALQDILDPSHGVAHEDWNARAGTGRVSAKKALDIE